MSVRARAERVFRRVLRLPARGGGPFTPDSVPGWDSLRHLELAAALEAEFGASFTAAELLELRSLPGTLALVERKTAPPRSSAG